MMHDMIKLQELLYIFVLNDVYVHKVMHDVKLEKKNILISLYIYIYIC